MTTLKGKTPTPAELNVAYREAFAPALEEAGGKDGRISRASAKRMAERSDAGKLLADNLENFFDATGQKSVSAKRFTAVVGDYVERQARRAAGSNQKLSLAEIRNLPQDLQRDVRHLRGQDRLETPQGAPRIEFEENAIYEFLYPEDGARWTPSSSITTGQVSADGTQLSGLNGSDELNAIAQKLAPKLWDYIWQYQGTDTVQLGPQGAGTLKLGPAVNDDTGEKGYLVHWDDLDDSSFAWFFSADLTEGKEVYLN